MFLARVGDAEGRPVAGTEALRMDRRFGQWQDGAGGEDHMRMNIATSRKMLELALNNLARALKTT